MWLEARDGTVVARRRQRLRSVLAKSSSGADDAEPPSFSEPPDSVLRAWRKSFLPEETQLRMAVMRAHVDTGAVFDMTFLGYRALRFAQDAWLISQLIHTVRPDVIIELGTSFGGGALYWASVLELTDPSGEARVVTVDILDEPLPTCRREVGRSTCLPSVREHPLWQKRVDFVGGSSDTEPVSVQRVYELCRGKQRVMLLVDSLHEFSHVLTELQLYSPLVTPGSYMIVEDTSAHFAKLDASFFATRGNVLDAVLAFMQTPAYSDHFVWDREVEESLFFTNNPFGYHRRISPTIKAGPATGGDAMRAPVPLR
jgi:cephalosporin hydroxylase